ncbi:MAG: NADP-dependent phosphogluconate dehydrogenase [Fimbriimonas sp.]|nr:NADP-dependent phosphogluconate dehydrogenase [Fimbriimonas sp.]
MADTLYDFGMVGLGTMGRALLLNMADHGFAVAGLDTDTGKVDALHSEGAGKPVKGFGDAAAFVQAIRKPRAIMMLVPAGAPVDSVIHSLSPFLEERDFLIDGGNSYFKDTDRRALELTAKGLGFIGMGVSGGESGARHGPSMMPGGTEANYARIKPIVESVAAHFDGEPCVALMGSGSAGHYVKTVHNGIEYAVMQMISEVYDVMKRGLGLSNAAIADTFDAWNHAELQSFLVEITTVVLRYKDEATGKELVELISDKAKQKGTGKWTSQDAMDLGMPIPTVDVAVAAREMSGLKAERVEAAKVLKPSGEALPYSGDEAIECLRHALYAAVLIAYAQGLALLKEASREYGYGTNLETVAKVWRAGCIIRSRSLETIRAAYAANPDLANILVDPTISKIVLEHECALRKAVMGAIQASIPVPSLSASIAYLDGYRSEILPANLIQGQRDLFGAHTYERTDKEGAFHTQWEQA